MITYAKRNYNYRNINRLIFYYLKAVKTYIIERYDHLKFCFTAITPSETNYHRNPICYQYQCIEPDCGKYFEMSNEDQYCPHCGSRGYTPVSGIRRSISYNGNKLILNNNIERINRCEPI